ncbi:MAG: hypothetical protein JW976_07810 [Syntrophaceae bacterium]|nr:hypothetical protein [Syntrophaceae bacterium]
MITVWEVLKFRRRLESDPDNLDARRSFHENYEWLEGYWLSKFGEYHFDKVWKKYGNYYWQNLPEIQQISRKFADLRPVGNNENLNYEPTQEVITATNLLQTLNKTPNTHFRALMIIVRQIRNNLFHGKKMELSDELQYQRNKELVKLAKLVTEVILESLIDAEAICG